MEKTDKAYVLVLGASTKKDRYSNKAIVSLVENGYKVIPLGREKGAKISGHSIVDSLNDIPKSLVIDTVSVYLNEGNQAAYQDQIILLKPKRVIFNPGAESNKFYIRLKENDIEAINACTLVMLSVGTF